MGICGECQNTDCSISGERGIERDQINQERRRVGEVKHPRASGHHCYREPDRVLTHALSNFLTGPALTIQTHLCISVPFHKPFDMQEQISPHSLGAKISAPRATNDGRDQKQPNPRHDQQSSDVEKFFRLDLDKEKIEASIG